MTKLIDISEMKIVAAIAVLKMNGFKYHDVKSKLRSFYNELRDPEFSYEQFEKKFDTMWGNTIEIIPKEELK